MMDGLIQNQQPTAGKVNLSRAIFTACILLTLCPMKQWQSTIKSISESLWGDVVGVGLVIGASLAMGYHTTVINGWPIGWMSTIGVAVSMMATRFVTRRNNTGNMIGLVATVNSAMVDYYLGNKGALLTYPITFITNAVSTYYWSQKKDRVPRPVDAIYYGNILLALVLALGLNYVGYTDFLSSAIQPEDLKMYWVTTAITTLTFSGSFNNPRMYADSWLFWEVYNGLKLYQNSLFGNVAYVAKYIFYFVNAALAWITWHAVRKDNEHKPHGL